MNYQSKIKSREKLISIAKKLHQQGNKIIMTGGFFDIIHPGHTRYLQKAKNLGDILIVVVNSDGSTRNNKGPKRPINNQEIRLEIIASLESVDYVAIFNELTPKEIIAEIKPSVWIKGGQYKETEIPETLTVKQCGGKVIIIPLEKDFSVSSLIEKIIKEKPTKICQTGSFSR